MRCLNPADSIVSKVADRATDKVRTCDVVGVENNNELTVGHLQCVVDVPGFRVQIVLSGDVVHTHFFTQNSHVWSIAVVKHVDLAGIIKRQIRLNTSAQQMDVLIIGRQKYVDRASGKDRHQRGWRGVSDLPVVQQHQEDTMAFGQQYDHREALCCDRLCIQCVDGPEAKVRHTAERTQKQKECFEPVHVQPSQAGRRNYREFSF